MNTTKLRKLKPAIPKKWLFYVATFVWGIVSYRILSIGLADIYENPSYSMIYIPAGLILSLPFFKYFFLRITNRHIGRILQVKSERPCLFSFFDIKGYLIMSFMIVLGITAHKISAIPHRYLGVFYISLGLSLFFSALHFFISGIRYKQKDILPNPLNRT
ncbi:MAG: hypothetical protein ACUBOA_06660 [Candidatus Loosdrechtia sp.]|uniref:hypothetical protein n=1 Tax=Candidatus Loosdrechtia sp. TaxID=3101272 RepID=UPI003A7A699A|nr:MAG: hypothetical protein QY305_10375 [Candidatus Jettenia sp. AMX2]